MDSFQTKSRSQDTAWSVHEDRWQLRRGGGLVGGERRMVTELEEVVQLVEGDRRDSD